ncbi:hypothetical protein BDN70DRAFT_529605 [Pholiota conissans]|uniref:HMG box domain-containing protein n=1 Tax=Pholiota conissans TaxID=109636 RepID=A0A9P5Z5N7_9AGAR|nr:hypothetical protein BDN70DRAFT_529605 [Pholiota conissans]
MQSSTKLILPEPTYSLPDPSKKSHARRQPAGHIPRPRNAFILFRCDFVRQKKIPHAVEADHRNISRIVGRIWREMTAVEREPWVKMADAEKAQHMRIHPGYRFTRGNPNGKKRSKRGDDVSPLSKEDLASLSSDDAMLALDRAASCPVGALRVPSVNLEFSHGYGTPMKTRDDLERRPSRVTLYQSAYDLQSLTFPTDNFDKDYHPVDYWENVKDTVKAEEEDRFTKQVELDGGFDGPFHGLSWTSMHTPYPVCTLGRMPEGLEISPTMNAAPGGLLGEFSKNQYHQAITFEPETLPPLPNPTLPYPFAPERRPSFLAPRKHSLFENLTLPPLPVRKPSAVSANLKPCFDDIAKMGYSSIGVAASDDQPSSSWKPVMSPAEILEASKHAHAVAAEVMQEYHSGLLSRLTMGNN